MEEKIWDIGYPIESDVIATLDENGSLTIEGTGAMMDYSVFSPKVPWVKMKRDILNVVIKSGVTNIGNNAFDNCSALTSVTIPESVTSIGDSAFKDCIGLSSISIPEGVTVINALAFCGCNGLTSLTIPDNVTIIKDYAFNKCHNLRSITISKGVAVIGLSVFEKVCNLDTFTVSEENENYSSENGVLFNKDKTKLIKYPSNKPKTTYSVPNSVTIIGDSAFCNCETLTSITIPESVTHIGDRVFCGCSGITSITIPKNVPTIVGHTIRYCTNLNTITVSEGNEFYSSKDGVLFNKDKTILFQYPAGKPETSYSIPNSVTTIEEFAFLNCSILASITIPESVTLIQNHAFSHYCALQSITVLAKKPSELHPDAFSGVKNCKLIVPGKSFKSYKTAWAKFIGYGRAFTIVDGFKEE